MIVQLKEYQMLFVRIPREIEVFFVVFFLIVRASRNDEDFFSFFSFLSHFHSLTLTLSPFSFFHRENPLVMRMKMVVFLTKNASSSSFFRALFSSYYYSLTWIIKSQWSIHCPAIEQVVPLGYRLGEEKKERKISVVNPSHGVICFLLRYDECRKRCWLEKLIIDRSSSWEKRLNSSIMRR